jgi:hypothetical protein
MLPEQYRAAIDDCPLVLIQDMDVMQGDLWEWMRATQAPYVYGQPSSHADKLLGCPLGTWILHIPQMCQHNLDVSICA